MTTKIELTADNRHILSQAFADHKKVDISIDCVVEGRLGEAFVDTPENPTAYRISVGPFHYFAGDPKSGMMQDFPAFNLLMAPSPKWEYEAKAVFGDDLKEIERMSFSADNLTIDHLTTCLQNSTHADKIIPFNEAIITQLTSMEDQYFGVDDFGSVENFLAQSLGFTILNGDKIMGIAYGSLISLNGLEVSLFVEEDYRRQGVATALSAKLLIESLKRNLRPNWDAANAESRSLAEKLGYEFVESYSAFYHTRS